MPTQHDMKSKVTTYILIAVVIVVWGIIAWKLFSSKPAAEPVSTVVSREHAHKKEDKDTLWLNYRDPFLGKNMRPSPQASRPMAALQPLPPKPAPSPDPKPVLHDIKYYGRIMKDGHVNCLVEIEKEQYALRHGEVQGGYRLIGIFADSLQFEKDEILCCVKITR